MIPNTALISEAALLGALLLDPNTLDTAQSILPGPEVFYHEAHVEIYRIICKIDTTKGSANIVTLVEDAQSNPAVMSVGGSAYIEKLASETPGPAGVAVWAKDVLTAYRRRQMVAHCTTATFDLAADPASFEHLLDRLETSLMGLHDNGRGDDVEPLGTLLDAEYDRLNRGGGRDGVVPTGFAELDTLLSGGPGPGDMVVIAGRPGMGKSAIGLCIAVNLAGRGDNVGFLSLEMGKASLAQRCISITTGVSLASIVSGQITDIGRTIDWSGAEALRTTLYVDDKPGVTPMQIRARARQMKRKFGIKSLVVDYMQLLSTGGRVESRQVEVSEISRKLKELARELEMPVYCLAQLNRGVEGRADNRPRISDLRESGAIEQDADVIILLHREEYYHLNDPSWLQDPDNRDKIGVSELIVAKHRNGPTGVVKMTWDAECARFKPLAKPYMSEVEEAWVQGDLR
jgi:replicative DNA helicase